MMLYEYIEAARNPRWKPSYDEGISAFFHGAKISEAPSHGTCWEQSAWVAGWLDALAEDVRSMRDNRP